MTVKLIGGSDGRRKNAHKALRKLRALGLTPQDITTLLHEQDTKAQRVSKSAHSDAEAGKAERLYQAQAIIRFLLALGFTEIEIGAMADVDHTTISHTIDPDGPRAPSANTLGRLNEALQNAGAERLKFLLSRTPLTVLDTCNDKGCAVDTSKRADIAAGARSDLQKALVSIVAPGPFVPGIHGALLQLGDPRYGLYLIKVRPKATTGTPEEDVLHLLRIEHEIEHILERFREQRRHLEKSMRRKRHVPKEGTFA